MTWTSRWTKIWNSNSKFNRFFCNNFCYNSTAAVPDIVDGKPLAVDHAGCSQPRFRPAERDKWNEGKWERWAPPKRPPKIGIWIEKFRCQNSNLNLPTIKKVFTVIRILKICCVSSNGSAHSFGIVGSYRSRRYAWIVPQRKTHGEPVRNVHILFSHSGSVWTLIWLSTQVECRSVR